MPILPRYDFKERTIIIPVITFMLCYPVWYTFLLVMSVCAGSGTVVISMFENIPDVIYVAAFVIGVVVFIALLASYSAFISNKKEEEIAKKKALIAGETYDADQVAISSKYCWIYALFAVLGAIVCSVFVLIAADAYFIPHYVEDMASVNATSVALAACAAAIVLYIVADKFLLRNAANGLFFTSVEEPLIEKVFQALDKSAPAKEAVTEEPEVDAAMVAAIAAALRSKKA